MPTRHRPIPGLLSQWGWPPGVASPGVSEHFGTEGNDPPKYFQTVDFAPPGVDDDGVALPNQYVWFQLVTPQDLTSGLECNILWIADTLVGDVRWGIRTIDASLDSTKTPFEVDAGFADAGVTTTVDGTEENRLNSSVLSIGGAIGAARLGIFGLYRDRENAADTMAAVARAIAIYFTYTGS